MSQRSRCRPADAHAGFQAKTAVYRLGGSFESRGPSCSATWGSGQVDYSARVRGYWSKTTGRAATVGFRASSISRQDSPPGDDHSTNLNAAGKYSTTPPRIQQRPAALPPMLSSHSCRSAPLTSAIVSGRHPAQDSMSRYHRGERAHGAQTVHLQSRPALAPKGKTV